MNLNLLTEVEREKAEMGSCFKAAPAAAVSP